jgi:hypothetical protein
MEAPGVKHKALGRMELQQEHTFQTDLVKYAGFHVSKQELHIVIQLCFPFTSKKAFRLKFWVR